MLIDLIKAEENKEKEARCWQEWLVTALALSFHGADVPTYEEFKYPKMPQKTPATDEDIKDIREIFNLGG